MSSLVNSSLGMALVCKPFPVESRQAGCKRDLGAFRVQGLRFMISSQ